MPRYISGFLQKVLSGSSISQHRNGQQQRLARHAACCEHFRKILHPARNNGYLYHRTPDRMFDYAETARGRGIKCIIAGAGGAAHLPGMIAAKTTLPVLGVPVTSKHLQGVDSLLSIVQMPKGVPVATFAIGEAGATNAALFAVAILAGENTSLAEKLEQFRQDQAASVAAMTLPEPCI